MWAQGGAKRSVRLLLTQKTHPVSQFAPCKGRGISFERFPQTWQTVGPIRSNSTIRVDKRALIDSDPQIGFIGKFSLTIWIPTFFSWNTCLPTCYFLFSRALQFPPEGWLRMSVNHASITQLSILPNGNVILRSLSESGHMQPQFITVM